MNIVTLEGGEKYSVDVGFGGDGATKPLPLISGQAINNLGTQEIRLLRDSMPGSSEPDQKVWIYQYRNSRDQEWNSYYAFPELEFLDSDLEQMNYWTTTFEGSFQIKTTLAVKFIRTEDAIVGKAMMQNGTIKRNMGGKTEIIEDCRTEEERVRALEKHFSILLTSEEIEGIRGTVTELKG